MATVKGKDEGKSMFLKEYLADHPDAGEAAIEAAWRAAGHEGTISTSLSIPRTLTRDSGLTSSFADLEAHRERPGG